MSSRNSRFPAERRRASPTTATVSILYDISETLTPGASVPVTLLFVEGPDKRQSVDIDVLVRGVILPPPDPKPN